ncbi:TFIIB-type zinc ribbon-containing protein [Glycomyces rhizosphaerae]|uniref:Zf-TFIIB domain-containing protein n=1 Tax=Glycomyces rhizosphaerae TaxID=2054422 RepID=A0ABV7Q184_9ACTN
MMQMLCPKCQNPMHQYERNGVVVEQCSECKGIFLDRGELEHLMKFEQSFHAGPAAVAPGVPSGPPPRDPRYDDRRHDDRRYDDRRRDDDHRRDHYDDHRRNDDYYYKKKKKKSVFEDLFDF